jgi:outer membrane immunogenic protein
VDNGRGFLTISSQTNWLATARARAGVTVDRFMLYGTAGAAFASVDTNFTASCAVAGCGNSAAANTSTASFTNTKGGWAAGLGVEGVIMPSWTLRAEWLHVDLGTLSNTFTAPAAIGSFGISNSRRLQDDIFRVGLNYKVGG